MEVRRMTSRDAAELSALSCETFRLAFATVQSLDNIEAYCRSVYDTPAIQALLDDPLIHTEMACDEDVALGYLMVSHHVAPEGLPVAASELKRLYLLPQAQGLGVGSALLGRAVTAIGAAGRKHVWLSVADANLAAQRFYDRLGFAVIGGGHVFRVGTDRVPSRLMVKSL